MYICVNAYTVQYLLQETIVHWSIRELIHIVYSGQSVSLSLFVREFVCLCVCFCLLQKHSTPLEHQFSYEQQGILQLFIVYSVAYSLLLPVQVYAVAIQRHNLPVLLTCCLGTQTGSICWRVMAAYNNLQIT